jgi:hypothetical protein
VFLILSCDKNNFETDFPVNSPICLDQLKSDTLLQEIIAWKVNDQTIYYLKTCLAKSDGYENLVNDQCEIICNTCGECFQPKCLTDILKKLQGQKIIWKR